MKVGKFPQKVTRAKQIPHLMLYIDMREKAFPSSCPKLLYTDILQVQPIIEPFIHQPIEVGMGSAHQKKRQWGWDPPIRTPHQKSILLKQRKRPHHRKPYALYGSEVNPEGTQSHLPEITKSQNNPSLGIPVAVPSSFQISHHTVLLFPRLSLPSFFVREKVATRSNRSIEISAPVAAPDVVLSFQRVRDPGSRF